MASENPFPLNILPKVDSWEKEQLLMHIHPTLKLTADEINILFAALNYLNENISVSGYAGNVPVTLQIVDVDHSLPGSTAHKVVGQINSWPNYPLVNGAEQWFYTRRMVLSSGAGIATTGLNYAVITEYFKLKTKIPLVSGSASLGTGGTTITTNDLIVLPAIDTRNIAPQEFDLGDIAADDVWTAANTSGPRATPNVTTIVFRAIQNGEEKAWLYVGEQEAVGIGYAPVANSDFRIFPADGTGADPEPPSVNAKINVYDDIDELIIRQREQTERDLNIVRDAIADTNITFPTGETRRLATYHLKSTVKTESITDYELQSCPYGNGGTGGTPFDPTYLENDITDLQNGKQDKEAGKGLSEENYTTAEKNKLASITAIFTTALKNAYDNVVTWISTNGQNVLDHISSPHAPANAQPNDPNTTLQGNTFNNANQLLKLDANGKLQAEKIADLGNRVLEEIGVFEEDDIADLIAGTYTTGSEVKVLDASGDTNLTFPTGASKIAFYKKLNSTNADLTDWQLISAPYATMKAWQVVRDLDYTITPALYGHDIFIDDGITTFNPNTQAYQDNFEVILINTSGARKSVSLIAKTGVTYMVNGISKTSITFQIEIGGAIGIFRKLGTDIYIIRGQIV